MYYILVQHIQYNSMHSRQRGCAATSQVNGKGRTSTPATESKLLNQLQKLAQLIRSTRGSNMPVLVPVPLEEAAYSYTPALRPWLAGLAQCATQETVGSVSGVLS